MKTPKITLVLIAALAVALPAWTLCAQRAGGGPGGRGPGGGGRGPGGGRGGAGAAVSNQAPLPKDDAEKKILDVLEDMARTGVSGGIAVSRDDGRFLRVLTESIGAKQVVELGTLHGYSGIWFCLALRTTGGKLTTFEIDPDNAKLSRENFKRSGVEEIVALVEGDAHVQVGRLKAPIDLLFLDADKEGYIDYLNKLLPLVRPGGLVVAHNMDPRQADQKYVQAVTSNTNLETVFVTAGSGGIGVTMKKR
jgi:caffeoyl-CoA O-methyltransferase